MARKKTNKRKSTSKKRKSKSAKSSKKKARVNGQASATDVTQRLRLRFEESVDEVRTQLDDLESTLEKAFKDLGKRVKSAREDIRENGIVDRVRKLDAKETAERVRDSVLHDALDLPSKAEVEKLRKKVEQLSRKVRQLES